MHNDIELRPINKLHIRALEPQWDASWLGGHWMSARTLVDHYQCQGDVLFAVFRNKVLAGIFSLRYSSELGIWVTTTYVKPELRRCGISRSLKRAALRFARDNGLDFAIVVRNHNDASQAAISKIFPRAIIDTVRLGNRRIYNLDDEATPLLNGDENLIVRQLSRLLSVN